MLRKFRDEQNRTTFNCVGLLLTLREEEKFLQISASGELDKFIPDLLRLEILI